MSDKVTVSWTHWRGGRVSREVNQIIDVRDFLGMPGYPLLVLAANSNRPNRLAAPDIQRYLEAVDRETKGVGRSLTYLKKRRWMFQPPGTNNSADLDGQDEQAITIMSGNPELSIRDLVVLLAEKGIARKREWVRIHRCDGVSADRERP